MSGRIIWLTGQPGSGKTTIARALRAAGLVEFIIDGDELRAIRPEGFDQRGRHNNVARAQDIAAYIAGEGRDVAVALVAPYRAQREAFKRAAPVLEVYLHTRETRGREEFFVPDYEPPLSDARFLNTGTMTVRECVRAIADLVTPCTAESAA